jgi:tetratricopeptide (TPR) repeat protein
MLLLGTANATTWFPSQKIDPITGEEVTVQEIKSYGSYIYKWPSKFDMVFWPLTDANWIWFCPKSGYASFGDDFDKLSDAEKKRLSAWLKENYDPNKKPEAHMDKLAWMEKVYRQRQKDDRFWSRFYRLMAYMHRENQQKSLEYVNKALPLLQTALDTNLKDIERIEALFLLGEYNRRIGQEEKARKYFAQAKATTYKDEDGKEKVGDPYFLGLVQDRENLMKKEPSSKAVPGDGK